MIMTRYQIQMLVDYPRLGSLQCQEVRLLLIFLHLINLLHSMPRKRRIRAVMVSKFQMMKHLM